MLIVVRTIFSISIMMIQYAFSVAEKCGKDDYISFPAVPPLPPGLSCFPVCSVLRGMMTVGVLPFATSLPLKTQASGLPLAMKVQRLPTHSNVDGCSWERDSLGLLWDLPSSVARGVHSSP